DAVRSQVSHDLQQASPRSGVRAPWCALDAAGAEVSDDVQVAVCCCCVCIARRELVAMSSQLPNYRQPTMTHDCVGTKAALVEYAVGPQISQHVQVAVASRQVCSMVRA